MKILSAKEQIKQKLLEVDNAIESIKIDQESARAKKNRKENWGIFSFIITEHWLLNLRYIQICEQLKLLCEYRDMLVSMIQKTKD